jgi:hypothetical protein
MRSTSIIGNSGRSLALIREGSSSRGPFIIIYRSAPSAMGRGETQLHAKGPYRDLATANQVAQRTGEHILATASRLREEQGELPDWHHTTKAIFVVPLHK